MLLISITNFHKGRNIRSHRLTICYGLHQKTSFVSIQPHSSVHSGDSGTQRPTLPSWPSIRSFTWQRLETSSWSSSRSLDFATTLDLFLPTSRDRPSYGAMVERCDGPSWLCDDDEDDDLVVAQITKDRWNCTFITDAILKTKNGNNRI